MPDTCHTTQTVPAPAFRISELYNSSDRPGCIQTLEYHFLAPEDGNTTDLRNIMHHMMTHN